MAVTEQQPNARRYPRFAVELEAKIQYAGATLDAVTRDIGRGGICLIGPREVKAGSKLKLSLLLVLGESAFSESLELHGRVIWCTPLGTQFQVGAVFTDLTPSKLGQLDMFLRFLQQEILLDGSEPPAEEEKFDTGDIDD
jgi:hypothetical protein